MLNVCVTVAPAASRSVTRPLPNTLAVLGTPLKLMVWPLTVAVSPVGKPLELIIRNGPVPPLIAIVPAKPGLPTVHCVTVNLPIDSAGLITMLKVLVKLAPVASVTWTVNVTVPGAVGGPRTVIVPLAALVGTAAAARRGPPALTL